MSNDTEIGLIAFAKNGTKHPDAFVVLNTSAVHKKVAVRVRGSQTKVWDVFRTGRSDRYAGLEKPGLWEP